jgi:hypothetical protein
MALFDELVKNDMAKGAALGAGLALAVPVLITALWPVVRPMARSAIKAGLMAYEKGREGIAELSEEFEDLVAETQEELRAERVASEEANATQAPPTASTEAEAQSSEAGETIAEADPVERAEGDVA